MGQEDAFEPIRGVKVVSGDDWQLTQLALRIPSGTMLHRKPRLLTLMKTGVLALLGTICVVGICGLDDVSGDQTSCEREESKELTEYDDTDTLDAVDSYEVTLLQGHCIEAWLHTEQQSALLRDGCGWWSRGPPAA